MNYMFVDLEIIAANGEKSLDNAIFQVEPRASNKYLKKINEMYSSGLIREEEYRLLLEEYYDLKDRVLEEIDDKYKNCLNFKDIYEVNNSNHAMYEYVNALSKAKLGYTVYIVYYYNTPREYNEKKEICAKYFPNCNIIGINFYQEDYQEDYLRKRTNKAKYIKNKLNLNDLEGCILIDKSVSSCDEWAALNGISQLQLNKNENSSIKGNQLSK